MGVAGLVSTGGGATSEHLTIDDLAGLFGRFEEDLRQSMFVRDLAAASSVALNPNDIARSYLETASSGAGAVWGAVYAADDPQARLLASIPPDSDAFRFSSRLSREEICRAGAAPVSGVLADATPPGLSVTQPAPSHTWVLNPIFFGAECIGAAIIGFGEDVAVPHAAVLTDACRQLGSALHNADLYEAQALSARLNRLLDDADVRMLASATPEDVCAITRESLEAGLRAHDVVLTLPGEAEATTRQPRLDVVVNGGRMEAAFRVMERPGSLQLSVEPERTQFVPAEVDFVQRLVSTMALAVEARMLQIERDRMMRAREEWVADLSHDIRTPLATIRGYAELLATGSGVEEHEVQREAGLIARQATAIERLVQDLQTAFKLRFNTLPVSVASTDLTPLVAEALEAALWHTGRGRPEVPFDHPDRPVFALVDASHFSRIVSNLATNAFVHNPPDTRVKAVLECDEAFAHVTIADDGLGMDPQLAERACRRGERGDQKGPGSGLGMAIVHELTRTLGGHVRVDSVQGRGTSVTVSVPLDPATMEQCEP